MKHKIKVGELYLVGESYTETIKGTVRGDTTAVYSRNVGEQSAYEFTNDINKASEYDRVTACDYVFGILDRQRNGHYLGEIKLFDAVEGETVIHCNIEKNARLIAQILDFDANGMEYDWYEQHLGLLEKHQPHWVSVEERLPEPHEYVLCCGRKGGCFVGWTLDNADVVKANGHGRAFVHGGNARTFTHWMPLPEPPQEGES